MTTNIFAFVVVLGVLIFFHELGHFLIARLCGVGVEKFSLGFGPRLFGKTVGLTDYRLSAIPLGGYVKMVGEEAGAEIDPADIPLSFTHKPLIKRVLIVAAGPFFNLVLAVILFFGIFQISGTYLLESSVGAVRQGSPAEKVGLEKGDRIIEIDGVSVSSWDEMALIISNSKGTLLEFSLKRGESLLVISITPEKIRTKNIFGEDTERYVIGITASGELVPRELTVWGAVFESVLKTYEIAKLTVVSIVKLIQGSVSTKTLGGPIMIAEIAGQQAKAGMTNFLFFIGLLSINLAILNFLPIPVLDGGHLLFFFIEAVIGHPVSVKAREIAQQAGIFALILLMIFVFYNDITRIFFS
ncbi:RIP metalloprotease RseP [Thermodesulfobacteriota bacterium]